MLVVDLSRSVAGAFCARLLALRGDDVVAVGPLAVWGDANERNIEWLTAYLRSGVEALDGEDPAVTELLREADVVLTGWDAGQPTHDHFEVALAAPSAVQVTVGSFGNDGPYSGLHGSSLVDWAAGGYLYITGLPTREPLQGPQHLCAYIGGYMAASAVEVALRARRSGTARPVLDVATMDVMTSVHQTTMSNYAASGAIKGRNRHAQPIHPIDIIRCADGWVSVGVVTDAQYDALAAVVGDPRLVVDPRFADGRARYDHSAEFDEMVAPWFDAHKADEAVEILQAHGVPVVKMTDPLSVLDDPQLDSRGFWQAWTDGKRRGKMPGDPMRVRASTMRAPTSPSPSAEGAPPLSGVLVADVTDYWAGPMACRILADLGATVVRVERPRARQHVYSAGPYSDWKMHRGKKSMAIDLKTGAGAEVVRDLAARADVFVENFRPGVLAGLTLDYDSVAATNPGLVYLSLSGFGQDGSRARWASFGPILEAASSMQARTHYPDETPQLLGHSLPDAVGALAGAFAVLNRLRARVDGGYGSYIDIAQLEAYIAVAGEEILMASVLGEVRETSTTEGRLWRCRGNDAWVAIDIRDTVDLRAVADAMGCAITELDAMLRNSDRFDAARIAQAVGIPAFAILDAADIAADPSLRARGYLVELDLTAGTKWMPGLPVHNQPMESISSKRAPLAGAHSRSVLSDILGYESARIEKLIASGSVAEA